MIMAKPQNMMKRILGKGYQKWNAHSTDIRFRKKYLTKKKIDVSRGFIDEQ